jgi:uncharacterized protein
MRILITGSSGFIGRRLVQALSAEGHELVLLAHQNAPSGPHRIIHSFQELLDSDPELDAVINLAGAPILDLPWTEGRKQVLWESRVLLTQKLVGTLSKLKTTPKILLSGSAIGVYGDHDATRLSEEAKTHGGFGHQLCHAWEQAALAAEPLGIRTCLLRTGLVVGPEGGFLAPMARTFGWGLGGPISNGRQWMSWIHIDDHIRLMCHLLASEKSTGVYNLTAPNPVTNAEFTRTLARVIGKPAFFRVPAWFLKAIGGERMTLLLESQRVVPEKALDEGFAFSFPDLEPALKAALGRD